MRESSVPISFAGAWWKGPIGDTTSGCRLSSGGGSPVERAYAFRGARFTAWVAQMTPLCRPCSKLL